MDQAQLEQLVQEVAGYLQQGAKPEEVANALVQQGIPKEAVGQIIQAAMQMLQGGDQEEGEMDGMDDSGQVSVLEAALQEDPELVYQIIMEFSQLAPEEQQALMQEIEGMLQGGQSQGQPQEQAPQQPQGSGMF